MDLIKHNETILKLFKIFGYAEPSEIQKNVLENLNCENLIIIAQAGSGKTFCHLMYLFNKFDFGAKKLQAVIILPTRELVVQTSQYLDKINDSKQFEKVKYQNFTGGYFKNKIKIDNDSQIIIATVGKLCKLLISTKNIDLRYLKLIVIDEADKVALQNKNKALEKILTKLFNKKSEGRINLSLLSASFSEEAKKFYKKYSQDFKIIETSNEGNNSNTSHIAKTQNNIIEYFHIIKHDKRKTYFEQKYEALYALISKLTFKQCLIFYNQKGKGEELAADLRDNGWNTTFIHGDLEQDQRILIYEKIKSLKVKLIVSTDLVNKI
jgi:ATP-dependent RNA helicase DeaD